uniref:Uncharacterized protein n=1 Tax=Erwinia amylovora ATCC BAA-2158 TaxID=889211 RepID=E5B211_ERWAM|nr:hypothetical protein predicted by Glimmer/Critica [Erwinia amylovora ATCC BAA-2158]
MAAQHGVETQLLRAGKRPGMNRLSLKDAASGNLATHQMPVFNRLLPR